MQDDLIERLRAAALIAMPQCPAEASPALLRETIARIAALETEVARLKALGDGLRAALQAYVNDCTNDECEMCENASAALAAWEKKDG